MNPVRIVKKAHFQGELKVHPSVLLACPSGLGLKILDQAIQYSESIKQELPPEATLLIHCVDSYDGSQINQENDLLTIQKTLGQQLRAILMWKPLPKNTAPLNLEHSYGITVLKADIPRFSLFTTASTINTWLSDAISIASCKVSDFIQLAYYDLPNRCGLRLPQILQLLDPSEQATDSESNKDLVSGKVVITNNSYIELQVPQDDMPMAANTIKENFKYVSLKRCQESPGEYELSGGDLNVTVRLIPKKALSVEG